MNNHFLHRCDRPVAVKRFEDISAEPLFACQKRRGGLFAYIAVPKEAVCRKFTKKSIIRPLLIVLPFAIALILTGGICISVNERKDAFMPGEQSVNASFVMQEVDNKKLLQVVNARCPLPDDYSAELTECCGVKCDKIITQSLCAMIKDAQSAGFDLEVFGGFVCRATQKELFDQKVSQLMNEGCTIVRAEALAERELSAPGRCEYETGLLVNIKAKNYEDEFQASGAYNWLINNCVEYGFVQRYPVGKEDKTAKNASPFAFRYVGLENAKKMRTLSMCLEEYSKYLRI